MADIAQHDANRNKSIQAVSTADERSPVNLFANPLTHELLVSASINPSGTQDIDLLYVGGAPIYLGQASTALSLPVTMASDQADLSITATTLPLPTGAATAAKQDTGNTSLASVDTKIPALGQALAAGSTPVVLPAAQITALTPLSTVSVTQGTSPWVVSLASTTITGTVAATQSGTWNVATVTAVTAITNALPAGSNVIGHVLVDSGSTTAVTQATASSLNATVVGTGTFVVQATLAAETTKVIGTVNQGTSPWVVSLTSTTVTGTVTVDTELPAAATIAADTVTPTVPGVATYGFIKTPGANTWDRMYSAVNATNSTGTGITAVGLLAQFDDVSPTAITENQFGNVRMSTNRNIYTTLRDAAGNERGANINSSNQLSVSVDNTVTVASHAVTNTGTFAVQATLAAETTKVIGTVNQGTSPWVVSLTSTTITGSVTIAGTVTANQGTAAATGNAWITKGDFTEQTGLAAGSLNADLVSSTDVSAYKSFGLHISGTYSGTLTFQCSNDNFTTVGTTIVYNISANSNAGSTSTGASGNIYVGHIAFRYLRVRMTSYSSGTANGVLELYTYPVSLSSLGVNATIANSTLAVTQSGTWNVGTVTTVTTVSTVSALGNSTTGPQKAEDVASADADVGIPAMAIRKATPANTSGTDGDYEMLQLSGGRLWVNATLKADTYATAVAFTLTGASLASSVAGVGRQSTLITSNTAPSAIITVKFTAGTSPTANTLVYVYLIRGDGTINDDNAGASDAGITIINATPLGTILVSANTSNATYYGVFDTKFLGSLGTTFGVAIVNSTGATSNATGGNFAAQYTLVT